MADLGIVAADVVPQGNARFRTGLKAGEAVTAGDWGYRAADGFAYNADADAADVKKANVLGMFTNSAAAGQTVDLCYFGDVAVGVDAGQGTVYILSGAAGKCCPAADAAAGDFVTVLAVGKDTNLLSINVWPTGLQV